MKIFCLFIVHGCACHCNDPAPLSPICAGQCRELRTVRAPTRTTVRDRSASLCYLLCFHQARSCAMQARPCAVPTALFSDIFNLKAHGLPCNALLMPFSRV